MSIRITQEDGLAVFHLDGFLGRDRFDAYRNAVAGTRYDPTRRVQTAPLDRVLPMLQRLRDAGFTEENVTLDPVLRQSLEAIVLHRRRDLVGAEARAAEIDKRMAPLGLSLYPFQKEGVKFLAGRRGALLASSMGVGKTIQALAAVPDNAPVLVICPAVAKGVWTRETKKWRPDLNPSSLSGRESFRWPASGELLSINYDILPEVASQGRLAAAALQLPSRLGPAPAGLVVIVDEAHYAKSPKSQRTLSTRALTNAALEAGGRAWPMTGTPIMNLPPELWNVLRLAHLEREAFESWKKFVELFGGYKDKWGGMHWSTTPDASVPERLARVMLRHKREDVLKDLPAKTHQVIEVEVSDKAKNDLDKIAYQLGEHCDWRDPYALYEATRRERVVFDTVSKLRHTLATVKVPAMKEFLLSYEEAEEPLLVFSAHLEPLKELRKRDGWGVIDGSIGSAERTDLEEKFQRGELRGLGCSIKAAGTALTLTRAANELFVDESWTPSENEQAEDRAMRIGQTRGVLVTRMFADHELDKHVLRVLGRKEKLIANTLGESKEEA